MRKILVILLVILSASLLLAEMNFYLVSHGGPADPFWGIVMKGMNDAAEKYGVNATYLGPVKYSLQTFVNNLNAAIAAKPDGIIVTITDVNAVEEPLKRAIASGIPVIAINVPDPRTGLDKIPYLAYIGNNEYLGGYNGAMYVLSQFTPKRAVIAIHEVGHAGMEMRAKGIMDVLSPKGIPVEKLNITVDPAKGVSVLEGYLRKHPDTDMIFTLGPIGTLPAVTVVEDMGLEGKVKVSGFDLTEEMIEWIKEGKVLYTIDQQQYLQGYLGVEFLYFYNKYGLSPIGDVLTGPFIITKDNVGPVENSVKEGYR